MSGLYFLNTDVCMLKMSVIYIDKCPILKECKSLSSVHENMCIISWPKITHDFFLGIFVYIFYPLVFT